MWMPKTEEEIVTAVTSGSLEETTIFDAKREIDSKNAETAKDIAAMATDGGVIIYGIAEDDNKRPTILTPIQLAGQPEKITSIVRSSIAEPPEIKIWTIATKNDQSRGYLVVVVPPSPRAPHMVVVKGENRYYGRTATGNIPLTEAEVSRLYERRQRWEVDRAGLLEQELTAAPVKADDHLAFLHIVVRPVVPKESMLQDAAANRGREIEETLFVAVGIAEKPAVYPLRANITGFQAPQLWRFYVEGIYGKLGADYYAGWNHGDPHLLDIRLDFNGSGHLFWSHAARRNESGFYFFVDRSAANTTRFVALLGELYDMANYVGAVDVGLAITGLDGSIPFLDLRRDVFGWQPYDRKEYRRTGRFSATEFKGNPIAVSRALLGPLFSAIFQNSFDPFPKQG